LTTTEAMLSEEVWPLADRGHLPRFNVTARLQLDVDLELTKPQLAGEACAICGLRMLTAARDREIVEAYGGRQMVAAGVLLGEVVEVVDGVVVISQLFVHELCRSTVRV
jgi:hypothetical protein